eukprot:15359731-Ditylum_brightwellii.AAC.1
MTPEKVSNTVEFIDFTLQAKQGQCCNVRLDGHIFHNLPVFERGGQTVKGLHHAYVQSFHPNNTMCITTFKDLVRMLTKCGEAKCGLSTHYIRFRNACSLFKAIDQIKQHVAQNLTSSLIVMDHEQKILPMKYRKGQIEYYGKKQDILGKIMFKWLH